MESDRVGSNSNAFEKKSILTIQLSLKIYSGLTSCHVIILLYKLGSLGRSLFQIADLQC